MRFFQRLEIKLSEDEVSVPKKIQFETTEEVTQITTSAPADGGGRTETIDTGTVDYELPMGKIAAGAWFYLTADQDFDLKIDSGTNRRMLAGRPSSVSMTYASLKISTQGTEPLRLTWAIAGD